MPDNTTNTQIPQACFSNDPETRLNAISGYLAMQLGMPCRLEGTVARFLMYGDPGDRDPVVVLTKDILKLEHLIRTRPSDQIQNFGVILG